MKKKVSIVKCATYGDRELFDAVARSIGLLGGINAFVKRGERILLKPNLLTARAVDSAVTTHPAVVKALIVLLKEAGATPVVGDSPGIGSGRKVAEKCGILDVCRATGTEFVEFKEAVMAEYPSGHTFKRYEVAKEALQVDGIINLPKLKTHAQMFLTLAIKNMFGCVPGKRKPQWHLAAGVDTDYFAGMILDLFLFLNPRLTVMDGVVGMEGNGPGNGDPRKLGLVLSSADGVAMDSVIAEVLGCKQHDLPILKVAGERGQAGARPGGVEVVGEGIEAVRVRDFKFPPLISVDFAERVPPFIARPLRKALTSRPHVRAAKCTLCNICVEVCPAGVMTKTSRIDIDYDRCIRCYCCQEMCPQGAITSREGWLKKIIPGI